MKAPSSIVTPLGMNANGCTLTLRPSRTSRWISTKEPILQPSPIRQPYRLTSSGWGMTTSRPIWTSGAISGSASCKDRQAPPRSGVVPAADGARHSPRYPVKRSGVHLWVQGQRKHLVGRALGLGEVTPPVPEVGVCGLEMDRDRVVNSGLDAGSNQLRADAIALERADRVKVVDVLPLDRGLRKADVCLRKQRVVRPSMLSPQLGPGFQPPQLDPQDGGLNLVQTEVEAFDHVKVLLLRTPVTLHADRSCVLLVGGCNGATVAGSTQVLSWIAAEAADVPNGPGAPVLVLGAMGLAGVLDHDQTVGAGDAHYRVHVGWEAIEVNGDNGLGSRGDCGGDPSRVDGKRHGIDLDQHGLGARVLDGSNRGDKCERGRDHLIARTDTGRQERQV